MTSCAVCGKQERMPFKCKFCGNTYCSEHRLPENHDCVGLEIYREEWKNKPDKWVYEPFQTKAETKIERKKTIFEKMEKFLKNPDMKQVIYVIIILIILLTLIESI